MGEFEGGDESALLLATAETTDDIYQLIFLLKYFAIRGFVKVLKISLLLLAITINFLLSELETECHSRGCIEYTSY